MSESGKECRKIVEKRAGKESEKVSVQECGKYSGK